MGSRRSFLPARSREPHMRNLVPVLVSLTSAAALQAQRPSYPTRFSPAIVEVPAVRDALRHVDGHFEAQVEEWIRITEMPAKSEHEEQRAAYVKAQIEALGLEASIDSIGNVTTRLRGTGGGPTVTFAAHMDTVHPMDTDVSVTRTGDRLTAPGVFDNSASVANALAAVRAMTAAGLKTKGDVVIVWTVQEELGLRGMAYWLDHNRTDLLVALVGGLGAVNYGALGIYWSRMVVRGEG